MSYSTPSQMLERYDARTIGDLVADDGNAVTPSQLLANPNLQAALDDASGEIESCVLQGRRYLVADLLTLVAGTGHTRFLLIRLTCDIAMRLLAERRPWYELNNAYAQRVEQSQRTLDNLREGKQVFDLAPVIEAGLPAVDTPTLASLQNLNLMVDAARRGYYPTRRLPKQAE